MLWLEKNVLNRRLHSSLSLEERRAVWLPVGCWHFALCDKKPSKKLQPAAAPAKKKGGKDDEDVKYAGMLSEHDAGAVRTAGWTYQQVSRCSRPKTWSTNTVLKDWVDGLAVHAMGEMAKESTAEGAYKSDEDQD